MAVRAVAALLVVVLAWPQIAAAEDLSEEEARARYQAGQVAYAGEHWQRAFDEFSAAYVLVERPELLYDMARCLEHLARPAAAIDQYQRYLHARPDAAERAEIEQAIKRLRAEAAAPAPFHTVLVAEASPRRRITHRWWFWTSVVGGAAVLGLGLGLGLGLHAKPSLTFPAVKVP